MARLAGLSTSSSLRCQEDRFSTSEAGHRARVRWACDRSGQREPWALRLLTAALPAAQVHGAPVSAPTKKPVPGLVRARDCSHRPVNGPGRARGPAEGRWRWEGQAGPGVGQADAAIYSQALSPLHSLEADSALYGGLPDGEDGRGDLWHHWHAAQRQNNVRLWGSWEGGSGTSACSGPGDLLPETCQLARLPSVLHSSVWPSPHTPISVCL